MKSWEPGGKDPVPSNGARYVSGVPLKHTALSLFPTVFHVQLLHAAQLKVLLGVPFFNLQFCLHLHSSVY